MASKNIRNDRMKSIRIANGNLTQAQAAEKMGFTCQYYSRVERGLIDGCVEFWRSFARTFKLEDSEAWQIMNKRPAVIPEQNN